MKRKLNEDAYVERSDIGVWVVADGMGGHAAGEIASKAVTDAIRTLGHADSLDEMHEAVLRSIRDANRQLRELAAGYDDERVPGSTVVALIIDGTRGAVVWCGDSRIYRFCDQQLVQMTRDHSHVQELADQGLIKEEDRESHAMANIITRAIGIVDSVELDSRLMEVQPGDQFLLCSDGLSRMVSDEEINSIMANKNSEEIVQSLLHTALIRGATDNVTVICVQDDGDGEDYANDDESTVIQRLVPKDISK